jgi:hypothetical protein
MPNAVRNTMEFRKGLWASCASQNVQLETIIVKERQQQSASEKVYGTNPKWISCMSYFGEMAIFARYSNKKIRNNIADNGNTVIFIGYSDTHEKDVYKLTNIATNKNMMSRDEIWLNKTDTQHMETTHIILPQAKFKRKKLTIQMK